MYGLILSSACKAWSSMVRNIEILEKVQQTATKWITGLRNKSYDERLKILKLTTLEKRRK